MPRSHRRKENTLRIMFFTAYAALLAGAATIAAIAHPAIY